MYKTQYTRMGKNISILQNQGGMNAGDSSALGSSLRMQGTSNFESKMSAINSNENLKGFLDSKIHKIQAAFDRKVHDLKPFVLDQACLFVKERTE